MTPLTARLGIAAVLALAMTLSFDGVHVQRVQAADPRPDILLVILDDAPASAGALWSDAGRTPTITRQLVERGTTFTNAFGSTPLCCPGRVNILTGQYSHGSGVVTNDIAPFDPSFSIGTELQATGYRTLYVGKYLNGLSRVAPEEADVLPYAVGWDVFEPIWGQNGRYFDYWLWRAEGALWFDRTASSHSVDVTSRRLAQHVRESPLDEPVFAVLSLYAIHHPAKPLSRFRGDPRCASIEGYAPPSYNEEDISDKPAYVQAIAPLVEPAWPLIRLCESMLGVDLAVRRVRTALKARGTLADTLIVFVADNGMNYGLHRLGGKQTPYSTPIPLYMSWPARWGSAGRRIDDPVVNVDVAPTICAAAGCDLGSGPSGFGPSGIDLLPLLDGDRPTLGRTVIYEEMLAADVRTGRPPWTAVRTSPAHELGAWHYVRYATGETELYETGRDPWELDNLSGHPSVRRVEDLLDAMLGRRMTEAGINLRKATRVTVRDDGDREPRRIRGR